MSIDNHYKMDLAPKKEAIKVMIQDELTKLSEEADEDDGGQDVGKKQKQHKAKEVEA
jgi:protein DEK